MVAALHILITHVNNLGDVVYSPVLLPSGADAYDLSYVEVLGQSLSNFRSVHPAVIGTWCNESKVGSICCRLHSVHRNPEGRVLMTCIVR